MANIIRYNPFDLTFKPFDDIFRGGPPDALRRCSDLQ